MPGRPKVHSGARAILLLNGSILVYAAAVQYTVDTDYKVVQAIDNPLPDELVPTTVNVTVTCSILRVPKQSASVLAVQPTILNTLHQSFTTIEIRDRGTNDVILYVPRAMMTRRAGGVTARNLAMETWTFTGIGYYDERTPSTAQEASAKNSIASELSDFATKMIKNR